MTAIESILAKESDNRQQIYLYREGVFYKAYERSAYLFVTRVKPFRVKKKTVKAVHRDVVSVGFPTHSLPSYFPDTPIEEAGNEAWVVLEEPLDVQAYEYWWNGIEPEPSSIKGNSGMVTLHPAGTLEQEVVSLLKHYPVEGKTPLECMAFLSELKKRLYDGGV